MWVTWVTIFVAHFLAKRTLEFQSAQIFQAQPENFRKPKIKILAVESEIYEVPPWDQIKHVIWEALVDVEEVDIKRIITALEEKVMKWYGVAPETARGLHLLRGIIDGTMKTCHLHMHCEAVFAVLLEARH